LGLRQVLWGDGDLAEDEADARKVEGGRKLLLECPTVVADGKRANAEAALELAEAVAKTETRWARPRTSSQSRHSARTPSDLAGLVDSAVDVAPPTGDLHVGLIDPPAGTDRVTARTCGLSQQRREPLHPPVGGDVVDLHASLGGQLFDVAVGQAEAEVPAHRQHDDVGWEAEAGEGRAGDGSGARATSGHAGSLAARARSPRTQQRRRNTASVFFPADQRGCDRESLPCSLELFTDMRVIFTLVYPVSNPTGSDGSVD
jgi:hypothetical protein